MKKILFEDGTEYQPSKVVCIGLNYAAHIEEMKSRRAEEPVIFIKPNTSLHDITKPIPIPQNNGEVHHEIELAVCIAKEGRRIPVNEAEDYITGYALALDLTLRDVQSKAKQKGRPWALAKGFDNACPLSVFRSKDDVGGVEALSLLLKVNGEERQKGNTRQMLFGIPEIIAYVSRFMTFLPGDILLTGTPAGVGPLQKGDRIEASIDKIAKIQTTVIWHD